VLCSSYDTPFPNSCEIRFVLQICPGALAIVIPQLENEIVYINIHTVISLPMQLKTLQPIICHSSVYSDCKDALTLGQTASGVYIIKPDNKSAFQAYCDMDTDGGGWTVFQHREDGSVDFYCHWTDYQQGFGNLSGVFWLGLEKIHRLTSTATQLRVDLQDFEGNSAYAQYSSFSVGDSASKYTLSETGYTETAGDSLTEGPHVHNGQPFSTRDQDNDIYGGNCAQEFKGGWWYADCHVSNLNGLYHGGSHSSFADGMNWRTWKGYQYSLKFTEMKLRKN